MKLLDQIKDEEIDFIFDSVCLHNFLSWDIGNKIPLEESREVFEFLKKKILQSKK